MNAKYTKISSVFFLVTLFLGIFFPLFSFSQERSSSIALTPLTFELTAERGGSVSERIRILNPSYERSTEVRMVVEDMFPEGEEGRVILQAEEEDLDILAISRWVSFEPEEFTLAPREERIVEFTINVPVDADTGGHYMGIIASIPPTRAEGTGVGIVHRVASLVLLTVPGEMREDLSIKDFEVSKKYYEHGPVVFYSRFENNGTVHLIPDAEIVIKNIFGSEVATVPVEKRNVLPSAVRRIESEWNINNLWGGYYTATIQGTYGSFSDNNFTPHSITFFAFPWKAGLVIIFVMIFFVLTRKRWIAVARILIKGEAGLSEKK